MVSFGVLGALGLETLEKTLGTSIFSLPSRRLHPAVRPIHSHVRASRRWGQSQVCAVPTVGAQCLL